VAILGRNLAAEPGTPWEERLHACHLPLLSPTSTASNSSTTACTHAPA
jgi:hypothetical protein